MPSPFHWIEDEDLEWEDTEVPTIDETHEKLAGSVGFFDSCFPVFMGLVSGAGVVLAGLVGLVGWI